MINLILNVIDKETQKITEYPATIEPDGNGEISLEGDFKCQKFNELIDIIAYADYSLEVSYNGKIANATYDLECNCITLSKDDQKRLLAPSKKIKK